MPPPERLTPDRRSDASSNGVVSQGGAFAPSRLSGVVGTSSSDADRGADVALVVRLKNGEALAFDELVRTHGPRMMLVIRGILPRPPDAEDALQDAFLNVFRSIQAFEGASRLSTWLHRVAANAALMRLRSRTRRPETLVDGTSFDGLSTIESDVGPERYGSRNAAGADVQAIVRDTLDRLHEDSRAAVVLRDIHGMELPEMCRVLNLGLGTIKSRLRRGRAVLRTALQSRLESGLHTQMGTVTR